MKLSNSVKVRKTAAKVSRSKQNRETVDSEMLYRSTSAWSLKLCSSIISKIYDKTVWL